MKQSVLSLIALLVLFPLGLPAQNINTPENFPDPNFRVAVEMFMSVPPGGEFTAAQVAAAATSTLTCMARQIKDLTGIQYFTGITNLRCNINQLTHLDLSKNTALTDLNCSRNQLTGLDISQNPNLRKLHCYINQIPSLDLSGNTSLEYLDCHRNQLTELDLSGLAMLTELKLEDNPLTSLDVSGCSGLRNLSVPRNGQLRTLNASGATSLSYVSCDNNLITEINLSGATSLTWVWCSNNLLTDLDLSGLVALTSLDCENNRLTQLDLSDLTALTELRCDNNYLTSLNISNNKDLQWLYCANNLLTTLDVSNNVLLERLLCYMNMLNDVDTSNNPNLEYFRFSPQKSEGVSISLGYCFDVALSEDGTILYVPDGNGTHVLKVSELGLEYVRTLPAQGYARNIKVSGNYAYIADIAFGVVIAEISVPDLPIGLRPNNTGDGMGLYVRDNLVYLAAGEEGLKILDVSNPSLPVVVGVSDTPGQAWDVWVVGNYAYIADLEQGMAIVDVSTPTAPRYVKNIGWLQSAKSGSVDQSGSLVSAVPDADNNMAEIIRGSGNLVHIGAGVHGLVTIDISDPENPVVKDTFKSGPNGYGEGLAVDGTTVYLANGNSSDPSQNGLYIIDASDPGDLKVLGKKAFSGWVEGVTKSGNIVYIANTQHGVRMIDVSQSSSPRMVYHWYGQQTEPKPSQDGWFRDISSAAGILKSGSVISFALEDNDGDGDLDIYVFGGGADRDALYRNKGNLTFTDIAASAGIPAWRSTVAGAWTDANGDGAPDLVLGNTQNGGLFLNNGSGDYQPASGSGIPPIGGWSAWLDIDRDNALDLVTYGSSLQTTLYRNRGDGTFEDISQTSGISFQSTGNHAVSGFDYNQDGCIDILFGKGFIPPERTETRPVLWNNNGNGTFTRCPWNHAITAQNNEMFIPAVGDFNRDGLFDLFAPRRADISLIATNDGNGVFHTEYTRGGSDPLISGTLYARGACTGDYDNDGYLDIAVMDRYSGHLFKGLAGLTFSDVTNIVGLQAEGEMSSSAWADLDGDRDLDLLALDADGNLHLWENRAPIGNALLVIPLTDSDGDVKDGERGQTAVGAVVQVDLDGDGDFAVGESDTLLMRDISAAPAGRSQPWAHFGLGEAQNVDVRVTFTDGTIVNIADVPANERLIVRDTAETAVKDYMLH
ncbi:MAG TPA: FG-GAP-like repeat-containing protein [bacterium]|nr:FG-GAP-like repeat-containing protein [bacterium]